MSFIESLPEHGQGEIMCIFEAHEPGGDMHRRVIARPLPKEIEAYGGKFVLDYAGTFTASYKWVPPAPDNKFEEWHDVGGEG